MTLNGAIALILLYFAEFDSFAGLLRHSGCRISSFTFGQNWPTLQRGLSAIVEVLVNVILLPKRVKNSERRKGSLREF